MRRRILILVSIMLFIVLAASFTENQTYQWTNKDDLNDLDVYQVNI